MEGEKKEKRKDIVVLDEGVAADALEESGPRSICCWFSLTPFRA